MRVSSLEAYNAPPLLIRVWEEAYGPELLPVQEAAVTRYGVLAGRNLIVQAPTSAGKTFIGEMAATRAALAGRKVLYLVPTKALAEDKFAHFSALYRSLGLRVVVTTRDRRLDDRRFTSGDFDIAIAIPEKMRALWARAGGSQFLGLAVVDELQTLSEPERGPCLELLLGELRRLPGLQIVGLSASLGASPTLADYLDAQWLETEERPVELRKGVLVGERFTYVDEAGQMAEERFTGLKPDAGDGVAEAGARLAVYFACKQEPTILFVRDRATAVQLALVVAERLEAAAGRPEAARRPKGLGTSSRAARGPSSRAVRAPQDDRLDLAEFERTAVREQLQRLMERGVAFHSADLQFEDRRAVEQAFAQGRVLVLCSTPTLALGVNLPARNVIIDPQGWHSETPGAPSALSPISRADFENRAGRAGRLGWGGCGRGILLADSDAAAQTLIRRYLQGRFSPPEPALMGLPPVGMVLTLAAGAAMRGAGTSLDDAYAGTYSAYLLRQSQLPEEIGVEVERCLQYGLLRREERGIAPTPLGQKAAAAGVSFESFCWLAEWAQAGAAPTEIEAMFVAALTAEAREAMGPGGFGRNDYLEALRRHAVETRQDGALLEGLLGDQRHDWRARERAAWLTLALLRWVGAEETYEVECGVRLAAARLAHLGEVVGWLIETLAEIGAEYGWAAAECQRLSTHAECLAHGLRPEELPVARLKCFGLGRDHIRKLARAGLGHPEEIAEAGLRRLEEVLPREMARELLAAAAARPAVVAVEPVANTGPARGVAETGAPPDTEGAEAEAERALVLRADRPDQAIFFGRSVPLRPAEFRLLRALAEKAGRCVSYDALYNYLWSGEPLAEPGQISAHRSRICGKLAHAVPECNVNEVLKTIRKVGLMLNLRPQEVLVA